MPHRLAPLTRLIAAILLVQVVLAPLHCLAMASAPAGFAAVLCSPSGDLLDRRDGAAPVGLALYTQRIRAESEQLRGRPAVVFASEPMDTDPRWQLIAPGELVHVDAGLGLHRALVLPDPPRHRLSRADLSDAAAAAQHPLG